MARRRGRKFIHRVSMKTRVVNTVALGIALSDVITRFLENTGDPKAAITNIGDDFSGNLRSGSFDITRFARAVVPIVAAIAFKKLMGKVKAGKLLV